LRAEGNEGRKALRAVETAATKLRADLSQAKLAAEVATERARAAEALSEAAGRRADAERARADEAIAARADLVRALNRPAKAPRTTRARAKT
ncbi:MAG: hypothetical protein ACRDZ3_13685, partial [Acidimicrobiia bacterium]